MAAIKISVINACTVLTDAQLRTATLDIQTQIHRDFAPAWGIDADLIYVQKGGHPDPTTWWLVVLDDSDTSGALGYHDLTTAGMPLGKVFARTDIQYGYSWSVTMSHEILEMLADPDINLTVFVQSRNNGGRIFAYEVCDPCEDDSQGYKINNTLVSDFVYPAYFESTIKPGLTKMDQKGLIRTPFSILPGGYQLVFDIKSGLGWTYIFGQGNMTPQQRYQTRAKVGSRREKRMTPVEDRVHSVTVGAVAPPVAPQTPPMAKRP